MFFNKPLYKIDEVSALSCIPKSTLYAKIATGTFPKPVKIGSRSCAWRADDLAEWLKNLPVSDMHDIKQAETDTQEPPQ